MYGTKALDNPTIAEKAPSFQLAEADGLLSLDGTIHQYVEGVPNGGETKSGRLVAYALMVNDASAVEDIETDVSTVITDEARISSIIYENL